MLDEHAKDIDYCTFCPKMCRFVCPVSQAEFRETVTPTGKMTALYLVKSGALPLGREEAEIFHKCAGCLLCRTFCAHEISVPTVLEAARAAALDEGVEPKAVAGLRKEMKKNGNPFGASLLEELKKIVPKRLFAPKAQVVYWPGCTAVARRPQSVKATVKLLKALGADHVAVWHGEGQCCGQPLLNVGDYDGFGEIAAENHASLSGYKEIVSGCPACVHTFKVRYDDLGLSLGNRVLHLSELLETLVAGRKGLFDAKGEKYLYHDPCYLGRWLGLYDPPRRLLKLATGREPEEFPWTREEAACCGGGGVMPLTSPETSRKIAVSRLDYCYESGIREVVTACPSCEGMFARGAADVEVLDLAEVLAERVRKGG